VCGIVGAFGGDAKHAVALVEKGLDAIRHRGPDGRGVVEIDGAVHGHVRLALLDLTAASAQPFERGGAVLSFVGEVWNHNELRAELRALGETFSTTGDTEVLAAALLRWGVFGALQKVDGMFAFAWSNGSTHVLARDRFGKIPLHVRRDGKEFVWASERKALFGEPMSTLPPGSCLDLITGEVTRWYSLQEIAPDASAVLAQLEASVVKRLAADAPVSVLASGGLDSSAVLAIAAKRSKNVRAYAAVLNRESEDAKAARRLCAELGVELVEVEVGRVGSTELEEAALAIESVSKVQVEIAVLCLPLALAIARDGYKACLSGEGADELFGGYGGMRIEAWKTDDRGWMRIRREVLEKMSKGNFERCNKAFMSAGVECRLPYLDRSLVENVTSMGKRDCPPHKKLLKKAVAGLLPDWVIRRKKVTFQGESGASAAAAAALADPARFYRAVSTNAYGRIE
jgi:asparagine synthase (glutamine-hydrolysing)